MKAEIISVGTELLLGDIVNTNAQFISQKLSELGFDVYYQTTVGDNEERLKKAIKNAFERADLIITTGGLGPTKDDLTKETIAKYFNKKLILHNESFDKLKFFFKDKKMTENNKKQCYFPEGATIIQNKNGTAPGCIIEKNDKIAILLPGPPKEMKPMFLNTVFPYLKKQTNEILFSKILRVIGVGESEAETLIKSLIENQNNPTIAPYAKDGEMFFRITAKAKNKMEALELINPISKKIKDILKNNVYAEGNTPIEEVVAKLLIEKNLKISVAESCTGGMVSSKLINYPGISSVFLEGIVTYSNESKINRLNVSKKTLETYGAISKQVAKEMVEGIVKNSNSNIGLSTTGIAGPSGGTKEKPVGLVYIGIYINGKTIIKKLNLHGNREKIRSRTTKIILDQLRRELIKTKVHS
ncbi:putative competence-damage inducible protein [Tepiditoga spiralis]|uniref:CinA-like protein n=1 Tax=Tepiditoga spiralis TaxID=2108365 RepID=A0A7G1G6T9_9BACT|nr:competence/damage-inducible protein A [Tepiditoga spiralis]BBE31076.1 putative competence-damage inducible protein [Tepiditoga spiralis]